MQREIGQSVKPQQPQVVVMKPSEYLRGYVLYANDLFPAHEKEAKWLADQFLTEEDASRWIGYYEYGMFMLFCAEEIACFEVEGCKRNLPDDRTCISDQWLGIERQTSQLMTKDLSPTQAKVLSRIMEMSLPRFAGINADVITSAELRSMSKRQLERELRKSLRKLKTLEKQPG